MSRLVQEVMHRGRGQGMKVFLYDDHIETHLQARGGGDFKPDMKFNLSALRELRWLSYYELGVLESDTSHFVVNAPHEELAAFCTNCRDLKPTVIIDEADKERWIPQANKRAALIILAMLIVLIVVASYIKRTQFPD